MVKLCPFKKITTTRVISDYETIEEESFAPCDEDRCKAYRTWCMMIMREVV